MSELPKSLRGRKNLVQVQCACPCRQTFFRRPDHVNPGLNFLSRKHQGEYESTLLMAERCGPFLELFETYLHGAASRHYTSVSQTRQYVPTFLAYLNEVGISSLEKVTSETVMAFKGCAGYKHKAAAKDTSALGTFFEWARHHGHVSGDNPVVPSIHGKIQKAPSSRRYSLEEIGKFRSVLLTDGNERTRAIFELTFASALRNGEICRIKIGDLRFGSDDLHVGLPNKTSVERNGFFDAEAEACIVEWLAVRRTDCEHDFLFHNQIGAQCTVGTVQREFTKVFDCYRQRTGDDLLHFQMHRLRHTSVSVLADQGAGAATMSMLGGWASGRARDRYIRVSKQAMWTSYATATQAAANGVGAPAVETITYAQLSSLFTDATGDKDTE